MQQRIVLGTGSGRCGTLSLARLLSRQPGVACLGLKEDPPDCSDRVRSRIRLYADRGGHADRDFQRD